MVPNPIIRLCSALTLFHPHTCALGPWSDICWECPSRPSDAPLNPRVPSCAGLVGPLWPHSKLRGSPWCAGGSRSVKTSETSFGSLRTCKFPWTSCGIYFCGARTGKVALCLIHVLLQCFQGFSVPNVSGKSNKHSFRTSMKSKKTPLVSNFHRPNASQILVWLCFII